MSIYLTVSGVIVAVQVFVVIAVAVMVVIALRVDKHHHRQREAEIGDDVITLIRSWTDDPLADDKIRKWLKDGEPGG